MERFAALTSVLIFLFNFYSDKYTQKRNVHVDTLLEKKFIKRFMDLSWHFWDYSLLSRLCFM